jgi:class 3 adenylate cyclase
MNIWGKLLRDIVLPSASGTTIPVRNELQKLRLRVDILIDSLVWSAARGAVDAVRYQPRQFGLAIAFAASQPGVPEPVGRWLAWTRSLPIVATLASLPHTFVRVAAAQASRWFGPGASAGVRWFSGALAAATDRLGADTVQRPFGRAYPGLLVPHPHDVAVLAVDMRGFSNLTLVLHDSQYLADLIGEYLTVLTRVVERNRGVVFQYTGDGLLALFLPELAGVSRATMLTRMVEVLGPQLHQAFDAMRDRWAAEWRETGREGADVGLGVGLSFGRATIGYLGPSGKKYVGVIGEPINLAAFLCSQATAGTVLVDYDSFGRVGSKPPPAKVVRLRSKKPHQRIEAVSLRYGVSRAPRASHWLARVPALPDPMTVLEAPSNLLRRRTGR